MCIRDSSYPDPLCQKERPPSKAVHDYLEGTAQDEESLRLFYVACTRAKNRLILCGSCALDSDGAPSKKMCIRDRLRRHLKNYAFVLVGFMSFMKSQHELLRVLDEIGVAIDIYKPDPAMGQSFYDVEQQFAESATICKISKQDKSANLHLIACGDSRQELETLARNIWFAVEKGCFSFSGIAIELSLIHISLRG